MSDSEITKEDIISENGGPEIFSQPSPMSTAKRPVKKAKGRPRVSTPYKAMVEALNDNPAGILTSIKRYTHVSSCIVTTLTNRLKMKVFLTSFS